MYESGDDRPLQLTGDALEGDGSESANRNSSDKSDNSNGCSRATNAIATLGDPSLEAATTVGVPSKWAPTANTGNISRHRRSFRSLYNLPLSRDAARDSVLCNIPTHGLCVRRASEAHTFLGFNGTESEMHFSSTTAGGECDLTSQGHLLPGVVFSLNNAYMGDDRPTTKLFPVDVSHGTISASGGLCICSNTPTGRFAGTSHDTSSGSGATRRLPMWETVCCGGKNDTDVIASSSPPPPPPAAAVVTTTTTTATDQPTTGVARVSCLRNVLCNTTISTMPTSSQAGEVPGVRTPPQQRMCGVFGLFGTMERGYFKAFASIFGKYQQLLEPFLDHVLHLSPDIFPKAVNVMDFLRRPCDAPDEDFFKNPLISWPMQVLYTTSCFYVTAKLQGYCDTFEAIRSRGGLLASGKNFFSALAVSMSPTEEELVYHTSKMYRAAFFVGLMYSKSEERLQAHLQMSSCRNIALLLINISTTSIQMLLDEVNRVRVGAESGGKRSKSDSSSVIPMSRLEITRIISSRSAVVCGHPLDLGRLEVLLVGYANATGVRVHKEYLPLTAPENSVLDNQSQYLELLRLWSDNGIEMDSSALRLTLYSPVDGQALGDGSASALIIQVALAVTSVCQDLTKSIQHLREGDVLLEFSASFHCIGQLVAWTEKDITVLSEPVDCVNAKILPSSRRSAARNVLQGTFAKCAIINTILRSMHLRGSTLHSACVPNLSISFIDLGLLMRSEQFAATSPADLNSNPHMTRPTLTNKQDRFNFSATSSMQKGGAAIGIQMEMDRGGGEDKMAGLGHSESLHVIEDDDDDDDDDDGGGGGGGGGGITTVRVVMSHRYSSEYVVLPNKLMPTAMDVYMVSSSAKYHEAQLNCVLTRPALEFAWKLAQYTGFAFPPHTLLMCPTVLHLLELWDTYEFLTTVSVCG